MKFQNLEVSGAWLIEPERREDSRGYFARLLCETELGAKGLVARFVQVNSGVSPKVGTLRGLHYQKPPHEEVKVVRCVRGAVFDVIVDMREESPTYRQWCGVELDAAGSRMVYVPARCAHGYITLAPETELIYFASAPYAPDSAAGLRHDDPAIGIRWPIAVTTISPADASWPHLPPASP